MVFGYAFSNLDTILVSVEVDISVTLPSLEVVGLPASEVREARERVKAAVRNSGYVWPNKKVLVNLAPSDLKKRGAGLDLPIALAILRESGQIPSLEFPIMALGELQLNGVIRPVNNALAAVICAVNEGVSHFIVAKQNAADVLCVRTGSLCAIHTLSDLKNLPTEQNENLHYVQSEYDSSPNNQILKKNFLIWQSAKDSVNKTHNEQHSFADDKLSFRDLSYCNELKRAAQIAAAGWHAMLLCGIPGTGKTAAAMRIPTFLPILSYKQSLEVSNIYARAGLLSPIIQSPHDKASDSISDGLIRYPPIRQPHHSASLEAIIGSTVAQSIGEVSLAHLGLLILDEAPEFKTKVLQALREPLDTQKVQISRVGTKTTYPANCLCIFTCNLCPCGNRGKPLTHKKQDDMNAGAWQSNTVCMCSEQDVFRYWKRIGGALWDRIDIKVQTKYKDPSLIHEEEPLAQRIRDVSERQKAIQCALRRQKERFSAYDNAQSSDCTMRNGHASSDNVTQNFSLTDAAKHYIKHRAGSIMSDRSRMSVCKVSRTIADLEDDDMICEAHVEEALHFTIGIGEKVGVDI